jgi:GTP-binding protein Era
MRYNQGVETHHQESFRSGFVAVTGRPNVGKSTLINALLGQKIAAVSPRPQTTRRQQLGILTLDRGQIIFTDTPGVHVPHHKLGEHMNQEALEVLGSSDQVLFVVDVSVPPHEEDRLLAESLREVDSAVPMLTVLNKVDRIDEEELSEKSVAYRELLPRADTVAVSATSGYQLGELLERVLSRLPEGAPFFPPEQITDVYERDIAADLIREAALLHLRDEVPHSLAIRIDEYKERNEHGAYIAATLFVERESQKPIVIGAGGSMLKKIGITARREIEAMSGRKVYLDLRVKVRKNWRNDENALRLFGFKASKG